MAALKRQNRPTPDQAAEFDLYMLQWQQALSLGGWRIERGHRSAPRGAMASVEFDDEARLATYRLGDWGGEAITSDSLKKTALHESLHILLRDIVSAGQDKSTEAALGAAEHAVINVLERLLAAHDL